VNLANQAISHLNEELFLTLANIIDARDPYVSGHAIQVRDYAMAIAEHIGLPSDRTEDLRQAAMLHDIGKIGVSEAILNKPTDLTPKEFDHIKSHAALGSDFIETCQGLRHLAPIVRHHHERWDGAGYPDRLTEENIPLEARILAVCDAVEAMASDRPYRQAKDLADIIAEIDRCAGGQFDPTVARACGELLAERGEQLVINSAHRVGPAAQEGTGVDPRMTWFAKQQSTSTSAS